MTEILLTFKSHTKKKINYLRIQRFKRLIHWSHFDLVHDLLHLLTVKRFLLYLAAEFLCEWKPSIFWRRQKSCCILQRQIWLRTPIERVVFGDCYRTERIWNSQSLSHLPNKILCHLSHPTGFLPPRFWVVMWPAATHFFQWPREAEKRDPGKEVDSWCKDIILWCTFEKPGNDD